MFEKKTNDENDENEENDDDDDDENDENDEKKTRNYEIFLYSEIKYSFGQIQKCGNKI